MTWVLLYRYSAVLSDVKDKFHESEKIQILTRYDSSVTGGAYLISDLTEGGLIERGLIREEGLFTKSSDKDIFGT